MATPPLSDPDWKRVPATYTDVFDLAVIPELKLVRMAFSEAMGRSHSPIVRTAIMMPMCKIARNINPTANERYRLDSTT
jgi:hypothetical protein